MELVQPSSDGMLEIAANLQDSRIINLVIDYDIDPFGDGIIATFCRLMIETKLKSRTMKQCSLKDNDARLMANHINDWSFTELNLSANHITEYGAIIIIAACVISDVRRIIIDLAFLKISSS